MIKRVIFNINGMECPNCAMNLERIEDTLAGILMIEASYHKAQMVVEYNDASVGEEQIRAEIVRAGYDVGGYA